MVPETVLLLPGLDVLGFLVGAWRAEGTMHGVPVRGRTVVQPILGGAFLSVHETILRPDGSVDYEDLCLYRYNPVDRDIWVHHFSPPHAHESYQVLPLEGGWGFHWVNNSSPGPFVRLLRGEPWSVEVWHPDGGGPEVVMRYWRG